MKQFWTGTIIPQLKNNEIFVFGSNPQGIHGAGGARAALVFGAQFGVGRGLVGQTYALPTKNLTEGFSEASTGITYPVAGDCSVSVAQITENIKELYDCAKSNPHLNFLITFQYEIFEDGTPKRSLNGYTSQEMFEMFTVNQEIPENIVFHDSYKERLPI